MQCFSRDDEYTRRYRNLSRSPGSREQLTVKYLTADASPTGSVLALYTPMHVPYTLMRVLYTLTRPRLYTLPNQCLPPSISCSQHRQGSVHQAVAVPINTESF